MANAPTIPKKSATSTEVLRVPVRPVVNGITISPTGNTVKAAVLAIDPADATGKRVPLAGDYVAQTWETFTDATGGLHYWAAVLMGPTATLNPAGPPSQLASITYQLWLEIDAGSETIRRAVGNVVIVP